MLSKIVIKVDIIKVKIVGTRYQIVIKNDRYHRNYK